MAIEDPQISVEGIPWISGYDWPKKSYDARYGHPGGLPGGLLAMCENYGRFLGGITYEGRDR